MKKQVVIPAVVIAVLAAAAFAMHFNSKREIPDQEFVYQQLQPENKDEALVLNQLKGCSRGELIQKWGEPDGSLFGFYGDIWSVTENESLVVYYSGESAVEQVQLHQNDRNP